MVRTSRSMPWTVTGRGSGSSASSVTTTSTTTRSPATQVEQGDREIKREREM